MSDNRSGTVTQDMERVFAPLRGLPRPPSVRPPAEARPPSAVPGGGRAAMAIVIAAAAGLVALSLARPDVPEAPALIVTPDVTRPAEPPAAVPVDRSEPVVSPAPEPAARPILRPAPRPSRTKVAERRNPEPPSERRTPKALSGRDADASPPERLLTCRNRSDKSACLDREVAEADGRLRSAYAAAAASGVPVADMRRVRGSWRRALSRAKKEPLVSIGTLDGLTATVNELPRAGPRP
jgi:hypothetical protein